MKKTNERQRPGRKKLGENQKKKPLTIYRIQTDFDKLGGRVATRDLLNDYLNKKIN